MKSLRFVIICICLVGCGNGARHRPSPFVVQSQTAMDILSEHRLINEVKTWNVTKEPPQFDEAVFLPIPQPSDIISDGPRYYILRADEKDYFWIMVSFGLAGQIEWRGPISLTREGTIVPRWDNSTIVSPLSARSTTEEGSSEPTEPSSPCLEFCKKGNYHAAMRALPRIMTEWAEFTRCTGNTCEGAAGYEYAVVMFTIAEKGDADWGQILDDPKIPYRYKVEMIFEILEARLGKGAIYVGNSRNFIVPRLGCIDLDKEMITLPEQE